MAARYSDLLNVQLIIAYLKENNIKNIVLSPGGRNVPLVHSVENDDFFNCYSIVDERSAAFFGLGLIQTLNEPVAICCTSGTAASNYMSAVAEAYYQKLPLVVLTADRNEYYLNQMEDQMINQTKLFQTVCKKTVSLPIVKNTMDKWYCERLLNEAFLELNHHGTGPIQINFQVEDIAAGFNTEVLPSIKPIKRIEQHSSENEWDLIEERLKNTKKILIIYGQSSPITIQEQKNLKIFFDKYGSVFLVDHLSNLEMDETINSYTIVQGNKNETMNELLPDLVISVNGNYVSSVRTWLKKNSGKFDHWLVSNEGIVADPFRSLEKIFECSAKEFFKRLVEEDHIVETADKTYFEMWRKAEDSINIPIFDYSVMSAIQKFMQMVPSNVNLHLANSNTVRIAQLFKKKENITVFCNRGTNGIDGSASTFMGNAVVSEKLNFLLIGDLSFFYDMNSIWNRYINPNLRIMMFNDSGAGIFHASIGEKLVPSLNNFVSAEHNAVAKDWVESQGFQYLSVNNDEELNNAMEIFVRENNSKPLFMEVFTKKEIDKEMLASFFRKSKINNLWNADKKTLAKAVFNKFKK